MERRDSQPSWADIMEMEDISFDEENKKLKAELQEAKDEIRRKENKISFLQRNLSALEENYYTAIKKEREKAEHELKKKEEEIFYVRKRLHAQSKETERVRASLDEWKKSTKLNSVEEKWQRKVSQLEELLQEKNKLVRQADNKRRARAKAHIDTLAQLGVTESALKQSRQTCEALEQKIQSQLAGSNVSHQKKLLEQEKGFKKELEEKVRSFQRQLEEKEKTFQKEMEEKERSFQKEMEEKEKTFQKELSQAKQSFKKELSDSQLQSSKELFLLSETWERRAQQWKQEKRDLEETLLVKENILKHKEAERVKASHDEWKKSTERKSLEEKWQRKVSQLEELLLQKDKLVRQADNKRRAHAKAHTDTLAQLVVTQSALKQSRQTCEALEQKIQSQMAKNNVSHQKKLLGQEKGFKKKLEAKERHFQRELEEKEKTFQKEMEEKEKTFQKEMEEKERSFQKEMEEKEKTFQKQFSQAKQSFKKELSDSQLQSSKELFLLSETWERRAQQWKQEKRDLEEALLVKENILKHKEAEGVKASLDEWKKSTELNSVEEKWQRKVSQLEELLQEKDKLVSRADDKRRAHAKAHTDTLAQLGVTQSALKQSRQTCEALEQKIQSQLAESNVSHQKKLLEQEKGFKKVLEEKERSFQKQFSQAKQSFEKELSDSQLQSTKELFLLSETWERRAQQWKQEKRDLEETLLVKEKIWNNEEAERKKELQHLTKIPFQLQQLTKAKAEKKQKKNLWSCRLQK